MRITNNTVISNMMKHLQNNMNSLDSLSQKLSSGKDFQLPSESPIRAAHSLQFSSRIRASEQYLNNINQARDWMLSTESSLRGAGEILQRARELAIYGNTDTLSAADRNSIVQEVRELKEGYISIGNDKHGDRSLFGGQGTDVEPFSRDIPLDDYDHDDDWIDNGVNGMDDEPDNGSESVNGEEESPEEYVFQGDNGRINREVGPGISMTINVNGQEAFGDGIRVLGELGQGLESGDSGRLDQVIAELDQIIDNNIQFQAHLGAKVNRLDLTEARLEEGKFNLQKLSSENQDSDIAEVITNLKMQESVYRAALAAGARIMQPTLLDFLQ